MDEQKIGLLKSYLKLVQKNIDKSMELLNELSLENAHSTLQGADASFKAYQPLAVSSGEIVEGVFDGQYMIGEDGKKYNVPANYASKSKLVEGDILKLAIPENGQFIYKQIKPVARVRLRGVLNQNAGNREYTVVADGVSYKVLTASVTYFKGTPHDECIILVPEEKISQWAAIENIIHSPQSVSEEDEAGENTSFLESDEEENEEEGVFKTAVHANAVEENTFEDLEDIIDT
ncbi:MAG: 50S ribosomal protein L7/L12 [Parcubacteria group bacterium GW2011_GWA2_44_12]|nr:MAG: 50S ribosomal protein L7/L12 [Parcubacteria group bacterium GW2011_GWA2_44_12]